MTFCYTRSCLFTDISRLAPIKENLPDYISYGQIKLTLAILKYEHNVETITAESRYAARKLMAYIIGFDLTKLILVPDAGYRMVYV